MWLPIFSYLVSVTINRAYQLMRKINQSLIMTSLKPLLCIIVNLMKNVTFKGERRPLNWLKLHVIMGTITGLGNALKQEDADIVMADHHSGAYNVMLVYTQDVLKHIISDT